MLQVGVLYLSTALVVLVADAIVLTRFMQPLFQRHLGDWMADPIRLAPAAVFYLGYVAGVIWLVSWPAFKADAPSMALVNGLVLGLVAYGTYEFTSYTILSRWHWQMVVADTLWGAALTGGAAWAGVMVARAIYPAT